MQLWIVKKLLAMKIKILYVTIYNMNELTTIGIHSALEQVELTRCLALNAAISETVTKRFPSLGTITTN